MDTIATASLTPTSWLAYDDDAPLIIGRGPTEAAAVADFLASGTLAAVIFTGLIAPAFLERIVQ